MIPIRDHNPSNRTPYVTYALIALNVVIFLAYWPLFDQPRALMAFYDVYAMVPAQVSTRGEFGTLLSSMFLHGGWLHLGGNMLFLWIYGDNMEDEMGHLGFLLFYLASGLAAAVAHYIAAPMSQVPTVGASGAIAGVMGGYLLLFPKARIDILFFIIILIRIFTLPAWVVLAIWFALQIFGGIGADLSTGGVAYWAHAGGFLAGIVLTLPLFVRLGGPGFWARTHGHPPYPEARYKYGRTSVPQVPRR
ncbi:MAG: rhomboid family intramembrane serine protease [Pseudomonadota bacterium]